MGHNPLGTSFLKTFVPSGLLLPTGWAGIGGAFDVDPCISAADGTYHAMLRVAKKQQGFGSVFGGGQHHLSTKSMIRGRFSSLQHTFTVRCPRVTG